MQPNTLYIYLTTSALFLAKEEQGDEPRFYLSRCDISPYTPFATALDNVLAEKKAMHADTEKVRIFVEGPVSIIPMVDFSEEIFRTYHEYCIPSSFEHRTFCDPLPAANAMLIFSVADNIYKTLEERFDDIYFSSCMTYAASYFIKKNTYKDTPKRLLVSLREGAVDLIAVESGRLLAVNTFETGADSDIIYYTMGIASKLGVSAETDTFYVSGNAKSVASVVAELEKFARNINVLNLTEDFGKYIMPNEGDLPLNLLTALAET